MADTIQPWLSKPLWPAPNLMDKQKVRKIESIFDIWLTMPTPINYGAYHRAPRSQPKSHLFNVAPRQRGKVWSIWWCKDYVIWTWFKLTWSWFGLLGYIALALPMPARYSTLAICQNLIEGSAKRINLGALDNPRLPILLHRSIVSGKIRTLPAWTYCMVNYSYMACTCMWYSWHLRFVSNTLIWAHALGVWKKVCVYEKCELIRKVPLTARVSVLLLILIETCLLTLVALAISIITPHACERGKAISFVCHRLLSVIVITKIVR